MSGRAVPSRALRAGAAALAAGVFAALLAPVPASAADAVVSSGTQERSPNWAMARVDAPDGAQPDGDSWGVALDGTGRRVAFTTTAHNLGSTRGTSGSGEVVVRDLDTGATEVVDRDGDGHALTWPGESELDAAGRVLAFDSGWGYYHGAFRHDLDTGVGQRVGGMNNSGEPSLSADGTRIAVVRYDDYYWDDDDRQYGSLSDTVTGHTVRVAAPERPQQYVSQLALSGDGTRLAWTQGGYGGEPAGLYVRDVADLEALGAPELLVQENLIWYAQPGLSHDGTVLAYAAWPEVRVRDLATGVESVLGEAPERGDVVGMDVSDDGRRVAWLTSDYGTDEWHVWWHDRDTGRTERVAQIGEYGDFDLSADGSTIALAAYTDDLVPGDTNGAQDVVIARRSDISAPAFPAGAALRAEETATSLVRLAWDAAEDDTGVVRYAVSQDGEQVVTTDGRTTRATVTGLAPGRTYRFGIRAQDAAGRTSEPLELTVETLVRVEPGDATLVAVDEGSGRVRLTWDAAPPEGLAGYRVWRRTGDGDHVAVSDVDAAATTLVDTGLDAETPYEWLVGVRRDSGVGPHTRAAALRTGPLAVQTVTWTGHPVLGGRLDVVLRAAPGWRGFVEVDYRTWYADDGSVLPTPRAASTTLVAEEQEPGRYAASFPLADGTAQVTAMTVGIADGGGHRAALPAPRLPVTVQGALEVVVDAAEGSLPGAEVVVQGPTTRTARADGGGRVRLAPLLPGDGYAVRVHAADGRQLAVAPATVLAGRTHEVGVRPLMPATLTVLVRDDLSRPVPDAEVVGSDASGHPVERASTASDGRASFLRLLEGQRLSLDVRVPRYERLRGTGAASMVVEAGHQQLTVAVPRLSQGTLTGTVTRADGGPAAEATVAVSQQVDGRSWSWTATTGDDGKYRVEVLAGPAEVTVSHRHDAPLRAAAVEVPAGGEAVRDVVLPEPEAYQLEIDLYTRDAGRPEQGPLPIDWRVAAHTGLHVTGPTGRQSVRSAVVPLEGVPGDRFTVCADGREARYSADCDTVVLGAAKVLRAELHLARAARLTGTVTAGDGSPLGDTTWAQLLLSRVTPGGHLRTQSPVRVDRDGTFDAGLPTAGRYVVQAVLNGGDGQRLDQGLQVAVDLADGEVRDLGVLPTRDNPWLRRSSVQPLQRSVLPGGTATVQVVAHPDGDGPRGGVQLRVPLPAGTTFVEDSTTVDGRPVAASVESGTVVLDLPARDASGAGPAWSVQAAVRLSNVPPSTDLRVPVTARWSTDGVQRDDLVGVGLVHAVGVTLDAPATSARLDLPLSGRGPADATVDVYDGSRLIGTTVTTAGGVWTLQARLPDLGDGQVHRLRAQIDPASGTALVASREVRVDTRYPQLTRAVLRQPDGRSVAIDPRQGTARFPYVVAMGDPLVVDLEFAGRGTVDDVRATVGQSSGAATRTAAQRHTASVSPGDLGPVSATWTPVPAATRLSDQPRPGEETVRSALPAALSDYGDAETSTTVDPVSGARSGTVSVAVPQLGSGARMSTTLTVRRGLTYAPTAADLERSRATGVGLYGFTWGSSVGSDRLTVTMSAYVPEDQLDDPQAVAAAFSRAAAAEADGDAVQGERWTAGGTAGAAAGQAVARVGYQVAFNGAQSIDSLYTAVTAGDKYDQLNRLLDRISADCGGAAAAGYRDRVDTLGKAALAADAAHAALMVAGLLLAPATFGVGTLVVWGLTFAADKAVDYAMDDAVGDLSAAVGADPECRKDDEDDDDPRDPDDSRDPRDPLADPVWIHDPSGYVYEGVRSSRLEGVTATLLHAPTASGPWTSWDADWYGQQNPLTTDVEGRYGWDVPEGWWQVAYTKDGYQPGASAVLRVLPPHFDVDVGLVSTAAPTVSRVAAVAGEASGLEVTFSKPMWLDAAAAISVTDAEGEPLTGEVVPVTPEAGVDGQLLAAAYRFVPAEPFAVGSTVTVTVDGAATSYAGRPLGTAVQQAVQVEAPPRAQLVPLVTTKSVDAAQVPVGEQVGYAVTLTNPNDEAVPVTAVIDDLPAGFTVVPGSSSGLTTADPVVDGQRLQWAVDGHVPAGGTATLSFRTTAATAAGTYRNRADAVATGADVTGSGPTAPVVVTKRATTLTAEPVLLRTVPAAQVTLGTFTAVLTAAPSRGPVEGRAVSFTIGGDVACGAETDGAGRASCSVPLDAVQPALAAGGYDAVFDGDAAYEPSRGSAGVTDLPLPAAPAATVPALPVVPAAPALPAVPTVLPVPRTHGTQPVQSGRDRAAPAGRLVPGQ